MSLPNDELIEALELEAAKHEAKAAQLRSAIAILQGEDPESEDEDEEEDAPPSKPSRSNSRRGGKARCEVADEDCEGDILTTKPCKHCGKTQSRCELHGGRRSAAVSHVHNCKAR